MKKTRLIARTIWLLVLVQTITVGTTAPATGRLIFPPGFTGILLVLFPLVFFALAAFTIKRYPFDPPQLREKVDQAFGEGVFADFILELKPLLIFGISGICTGLLMLYVTRGMHSAGAHFIAALAISGGTGFLLVRTIVAKRGLSLESPAAAAPWASLEFAPAAIRRIQATKLTAFVAGGWTALGMSAADHAEKAYHLDPDAANLAFFVAAIPFFFIPVAIFVFGYQNIMREAEGESFWKQQNRRMAGVLIRGFCWMGGAIVFMIVWAVALSIFGKA